MAGSLRGIRVLDLATSRAELAGRVLADLGAEVIKVEPPGGVDSRRLPPFAGDGSSLYWCAVALGKRSAVLDITTADGASRLRDLAENADILVESFDPSYLGRLGLGYADLCAVNPRLIYVSVTPYGQGGPLASAPATELTIEAAGGLVALQGDPDRPPIPVGFPQAAFHAGVQAAADAIIALNERERSGLGQHLDVSMQAAIIWTLMNATGYPPNEGRDPPGFGDDRADARPAAVPGLRSMRAIHCADGLLAAGFTQGRPGEATLLGLSAWMRREAGIPDDIADVDFRDWLARVRAGDLQVEHVNRLFEALASFLATKTKAQVLETAVREGMLLAPYFTARDLVADRQLRSRRYWRRVGSRVYPGPFARLSATPIRLRAEAPALGEMKSPRARRPPRTTAASPPRRQPFEGLKVADFAWVGVGPLIGKALADHGATVVHVESSTRLDVLRGNPPFKDGVAGINRAQFMADFNSSKLGLALNLSLPGARAVARRLTDWADVVTESFTPGTMARLGLDWESLSANRPDLIMLRTCLRGQTGPHRTYGGFGNQGAALAGLAAITGWPDREPTGPWGAYTDFIAPRYGLAAISAALYHRQRTGRGQYIDLSQVEAAIHFVEPLVLEYIDSGRVAGPVGLESARSCPHGVYRARGTERYVAVETADTGQWRELVRTLRLSAFSSPEFESVERRRTASKQIDAAIEGWTSARDAWEAAAVLQKAGVPAAAVQRPSDLYRDAQLAHRGFFVTLDHTVMGPTPYDGPVTIFSDTPASLRKAAPALGEDTAFVLQDLLGMTADEVADLTAAGVLV